MERIKLFTAGVYILCHPSYPDSHHQIILFIIGLSDGDGDTDVSHSDIDSDGLEADDEPGGDITEQRHG